MWNVLHPLSKWPLHELEPSDRPAAIWLCRHYEHVPFDVDIWNTANLKHIRICAFIESQIRLHLQFLPSLIMDDRSLEFPLITTYQLCTSHPGSIKRKTRVAGLRRKPLMVA